MDVVKFLFQPSPGARVISDALQGRSFDDNSFSDWLYGDWNEEKYRQYQLLNAIPGVSHYMDYLLDVRSDQEYLRRYGMDYTDIHDPRKLRQTASSRSVLNFVSDNVKTLYS